MVCEQCGTQITVGDKFCPKCGIQVKTIATKSQELGKKIFFIIASIIFTLLIIHVYFFVFILVGIRVIMPTLPEHIRSWMFSIIFIFSIVAGILTLIPIYKLFKKQKAKKKCALENNGN
jgi:hypothetical protein